MRPRVLAVCLGLASAACFIVAYVNRAPAIEGAYFNSGERGWTAYAPIDAPLFEPFDPWDAQLWLGAGVAFLLAAIAVLAAGALRSRRS